MTALLITSMRHFMSRLLTSDAFDGFLLEEAVIGTASTYTIDGRVNRDFFSGDESAAAELPLYDFRPWSELKGLCFDLIKGRRTPLFFRFVLHLMPQKAAELLEREGCSTDPALIKALVLTIRYDGARAVLTTGTSFHSFVPSREPDALWDRAAKDHLSKAGIDFEELIS